jgi:hypothetical protein
VSYGQRRRPKILYKYSEALLKSRIGLCLIEGFEGLEKDLVGDLLRMCNTCSEHMIIAG